MYQAMRLRLRDTWGQFEAMLNPTGEHPEFCWFMLPQYLACLVVDAAIHRVWRHYMIFPAAGDLSYWRSVLARRPREPLDEPTGIRR